MSGTLIQTFFFPSTEECRAAVEPLVFRHLEWLEEHSTRHNLTRVPRENWFERHVLDSLVPLLAGWDLGDAFLDMGTGPGFPGLPLGLQSQSTRFVLVESKKKVVTLLEEFLDQHRVAPRGAARSDRIEDLGRVPEFREAFDRVVTRALAPLPVLIELGLPFLREGGELWCWKTDASEINPSTLALRELHGTVIRELHYTLPGEAGSRVLLAIRKDGPTPDKYPRRTGAPQKRPLV